MKLPHSEIWRNFNILPNITNRETKSLILILKPTLSITILVTLLVVAQSQAMNANVRLVRYFFMAIEMD
jgi:hypothetical protein